MAGATKVAPPGAFGPFLGMRYSPDPANPDRRFVYYAKNMCPADPILGGPYVRRPSDQDTPFGTTTTSQWIGVFRKRSGNISVGVHDGEIWTMSAGSWSKQVTTANLTTNSITMSATARVFCCTYNNTYVFNDGVNQPFTWNGVAGAGGLTLLSNAPTKCYGRPAVYYAKLFFIKDVAASSADRSTIVWSEENAANTGYEASGYTNVWTLNQNGQGALYALVGTNQSLYYFRRDAIGSINGAVSPAFTTSGVHDDVSAHLGTDCPSVLWHDGYVYFLDSTGKPWRFAEGGRPLPLWKSMGDNYYGPDTPGANTVTRNPLDYIAANSSITRFPWYEAICFGIWNTTSLGQRPIWAFSHATGNLLCEVDFQTNLTPTVELLGEVWDDTNSRLVIGAASALTDTVSVCPPVSGLFYEVTSSAKRLLVVGPWGGGDDVEWTFDALKVTLAVGAVTSSRTGSLLPRISPSEICNFDSTGYTTLTAKSVAQTLGYQTQIRKAWGVNVRSRWATVQLLDQAGFEGWGVYQVSLNGTSAVAAPDKA